MTASPAAEADILPLGRGLSGLPGLPGQPLPDSLPAMAPPPARAGERPRARLLSEPESLERRDVTPGVPVSACISPSPSLSPASQRSPVAPTSSTGATAAAPAPAMATPRAPVVPLAQPPRATRRRQTEAQKLFVLDTNVLMHDPASLFRFQEHDVYLPMMTLGGTRQP